MTSSTGNKEKSTQVQLERKRPTTTQELRTMETSHNGIENY